MGTIMKALLIGGLLATAGIATGQNEIDSLLAERGYSKIDKEDTECIMKYAPLVDTEEWATVYTNGKERLLVDYIESEVGKELILLWSMWDERVIHYTFNDMGKVEAKKWAQGVVKNETYGQVAQNFCHKLQDILGMKRI